MAPNEDRAKDDPDSLATVMRDVLSPLIAVDNGAIELVRVHDGVAEIRLSGACAGCPGQPFTAQSVVLPALQALRPDIKTVRVTVAV